MPILTEQIKATSLNLNDFVHIARPTDESQSPNGSSYKATIGQLIDANGCCLNSGTYNSSTGVLDLFGISGDLSLSANGIFQFSGGSEICVKVPNFSIAVEDIWPCNTNINIQPIAVNTNRTIFGRSNGASGFSIVHTTNVYGTIYNETKLLLNTSSVSNYGTINFNSYNKGSNFLYYDNVEGVGSPLFDDFQEIITVSSTNLISTSFNVKNDDGVEIMIGAIDPNDTVLGEFGEPSDTFLSSYGSSKGLNIVSTNSSNTSGYIRFIVDGDYTNSNPVLHIDGDSPTAGFMGFGNNNISPTSLVDINGSGINSGSVGANMLRLRTSFTVPKSSDPSSGIPQGTVCWDDNFLYIKTLPFLWARVVLSNF